MAHTTDWTPERVSLLKTEWDKQTPSASIAKTLGVSKNAVLGKAHRLNLPPRESPIKRNREAPRAAKKRSSGHERSKLSLGVFFPKSKVQATKRAESHAAPVNFADVAVDGRTRCAYPKWEKTEDPKLFCGKPAQVGKIYCPEHQSLCVIRPRSKVDRAALERID